MTWSGIYFAFFSNPHFPQLQNHSFNLQNHKMSQNHTYFRPCVAWRTANDYMREAMRCAYSSHYSEHKISIITLLSLHFKSYTLQHIEEICIKIKYGCGQLGVVIFAMEILRISEIALDPHLLPPNSVSF